MKYLRGAIQLFLWAANGGVVSDLHLNAAIYTGHNVLANLLWQEHVVWWVNFCRINRHGLLNRRAEQFTELQCRVYRKALTLLVLTVQMGQSATAGEALCMSWRRRRRIVIMKH
jgi:hypothetical protein